MGLENRKMNQKLEYGSRRSIIPYQKLIRTSAKIDAKLAEGPATRV